MKGYCTYFDWWGDASLAYLLVFSFIQDYVTLVPQTYFDPQHLVTRVTEQCSTDLPADQYVTSICWLTFPLQILCCCWGAWCFHVSVCMCVCQFFLSFFLFMEDFREGHDNQLQRFIVHASGVYVRGNVHVRVSSRLAWCSLARSAKCLTHKTSFAQNFVSGTVRTTPATTSCRTQQLHLHRTSWQQWFREPSKAFLLHSSIALRYVENRDRISTANNWNREELILKTIGNRKWDCAWSCSRWQTQPEKICKSQRTNQCHSLHTLYWFVLCNLQIFSGCVCHLEQLHAQSPFLFPIVFSINLIPFFDICSVDLLAVFQPSCSGMCYFTWAAARSQQLLFVVLAAGLWCLIAGCHVKSPLFPPTPSQTEVCSTITMGESIHEKAYIQVRPSSFSQSNALRE